MVNREATDQSKKAWYTGLVLFLLFLFYYTLTASYLPPGAGPDYPVSNDISRFVYDHYSIPVLPDNEEDLMFTPGGTTRATRPPASYLISGLIAHLSPYMDGNSFLAWRHGTGLTSALTLLVVFTTLYAFFQSLAYALTGAVLLGLMPQFTFIASYNNDDSAGILSASLVVMSMVFIFRRGINTRTVAIMAASCGFVLMTKFTAWLVLPFAAIYTLWQARDQYRIWWKYLLIALPLIVVSGGWWILFNMYHYGWTDPLEFDLGNSLIESHRTENLTGGGGFITHGIGYYQLLLGNHNNFIGESIKAIIGNLDWLKLRLGIIQYAFYTFIFIIAVLYVPISIFLIVGARFVCRKCGYLFRADTGFSVLLYFMIAFQAFMYVRFNLYYDIQIQGKYLLPAMLPILILFFSSISAVHRFASQRISQASEADGHVIDCKFGAFSAGIVLIALFTHIDAYISYVIPFYKPPPYKLELSKFGRVDLDRNRYVEKVVNMSIQDTQEGGWLIESYSEDPRMIMTDAFCDVLSGYSLIRIDMHSDKAGLLLIFVDSGKGFNMKQQVFARYEAGENMLLITSGIRPCKQVRIDPLGDAGQVTINSISVAPLSIMPMR